MAEETQREIGLRVVRLIDAFARGRIDQEVEDGELVV
jgi:hypothetical protein